jgi:acylpyruvate hydrolase
VVPAATPSAEHHCIGLNYADHSKESKIAQPDYPTRFFRVLTSIRA